MTDDNATEGRRQNHAWREAANAVGNTGTAGLSLARMLQDQGTLQVAGAVEPRRQSEVPFQKRPNAAEEIENTFSSGGRHVVSIPFAIGTNRARTGREHPSHGDRPTTRHPCSVYRNALTAFLRARHAREPGFTTGSPRAQSGQASGWYVGRDTVASA